MITDVLLQPDLRLKSGCAALRVKGILGTRTVASPVQPRQKTKTKAENDKQRRLQVRDVKGKKMQIVKETSLLLLNMSQVWKKDPRRYRI